MTTAVTQTSTSAHSVSTPTTRPATMADSGLLRSHECRSRDIKRRIEVIQKKMADLEELGVPCGFCYASIRNSGTLFTMGHPAITQPIERSRHVILNHLSNWSEKGEEAGMLSERKKKVHVLLPPLVRPLGELSISELRGLIIGIVKDLGLKWSDPRPSFWPEEIPFQYPRSTPDGYQGCWSDGLRLVLQSIYSYFNHDIASQVPSRTRSTVLSSSSSSHSSISSPLVPLTTFPVFNGLPTTTLTPTTQDDDEEEDVDVGTLENVGPQANAQLVEPKYEEEEELTSDQDEGEEEGAELERPLTHAVSYFGYELAQSESSHTSSPLASSTQDSEEVGRETPLPLLPITTDTKGLSLLQPQLLYCAPGGIYPQLYPALHLSGTTPLLLPPSLLMKQLYSTPTQLTTIQSPPADSSSSEGQSEHVFSQTLSNSSSLSPSQVSPSQLSPSHLSSSNRKMAMTARRENEPQPLPAPPPPPSESKNRKSKNGIYIYTNPTAPLRFMSLNNRKRSSSGKIPRTTTPNRGPATRPMATPTHVLTTSTQEMTAGQKLIAGAPVSPHTGEPVIVRTIGGEGKGVRTQLPTIRQVPSPNEAEGDPPSFTPPSSRKSQGTSGRKKRELVFHWYKSPEAAPPLPKVPKLLDSAV